MNVLIIEDELGVAQNLCDLLQNILPTVKILAIIETVEGAVSWLKHHPKPDLGFFDIRIADGDSFEIFEQSTVDFPIIFTTAYDEYALKAFKVNSIDYLLKPIDKNALTAALKKFNTLFKKEKLIEPDHLLKIIQELRFATAKNYKKGFLVYIKDKILPIAVEQIAYFQLENDLVWCITHQREKYAIDQSLDKIENQIDPDAFFRANRQFIVSRKAIKAAVQYFHRKLKLDLSPPPKSIVLISKSKAGIFKQWLEK